MAKNFEFEAPQFIDCWKDDGIDAETFFKENDSPQNSRRLSQTVPRTLNDFPQSSRGLSQNAPRTPRTIHRPQSFSVISRSGKRCRHSSLRDSLFLKEKEFFNKRILNFGKENDSKFTFKARPATVLKKEPFWPFRESKNYTEGRSPVLETEKRSLHRQVLKDIRKEKEKMYEVEYLQVIKEDEEELKKYRRTLEFKAKPIKK